jgi:hypothetical protein
MVGNSQKVQLANKRNIVGICIARQGMIIKQQEYGSLTIEEKN